MVRRQQAFASYCIASWESFLSNSWYTSNSWYEIAAPIRAETSVFHISRLSHNTYFSTISRQIQFSIPGSFKWSYNKSNNSPLCLTVNIRELFFFWSWDHFLLISISNEKKKIFFQVSKLENKNFVKNPSDI